MKERKEIKNKEWNKSESKEGNNVWLRLYLKYIFIKLISCKLLEMWRQFIHTNQTENDRRNILFQIQLVYFFFLKQNHRFLLFILFSLLNSVWLFFFSIVPCPTTKWHYFLFQAFLFHIMETFNLFFSPFKMFALVFNICDC